MWLWFREKWAWWVGLIGALILVGYGIIPTLQPAHFGISFYTSLRNLLVKS